MLQDRDIVNLLLVPTIAEEGSMNRAAKALFTSQPALTRMIQDLEAALGEQVFERHAKGVRLTPVGEVLLRHARTIRAEANAALYDIDRLRRDGRRHILIGAAPYHPLNVLSRSLAEIVTSSPDLDIHMQYAAPHELLDLLNHGRVEMIIGPLLTGKSADDYIQEVLFYDEMAIFCRAGHRLAGRNSIGVQQLLGEMWVLGPPNSLVRNRVEAIFRNEGYTPPHVQLEVDDVATRRALVVHGDFLSAFQRNQAQNEVQAGLLAPVKFQWPQSTRPIGVIRSTPHNELSKYVTDVLKHYYSLGWKSVGWGPPPGED